MTLWRNTNPLGATKLDWFGSHALVTGGAGFIGSNLVQRLVQEGVSVRVADNLSRSSTENLKEIWNRIEFLNIDLTDEKDCIRACEGIDSVFHLAASVGGIQYIEKEHVGGSTPSLLMNTNMLEAARQRDVKRFLFTSSACVYKEKSLGLNRFSEDDAYPANPATTYGWVKLMGEIQCRSYFIDYGLKSCCPRLFNVFGEKENLDPSTAHAIPSLIRKAINYPQEQFTVFGDGKQERAFLYVKDCVDGVIRCIQTIEDGSAINLGSNEVTSISDVARQIVALSGKDIDIEYDLSGPQGTHRYCADTTKMEELLGWHARTPLQIGLKNTYKWALREISSHQAAGPSI